MARHAPPATVRQQAVHSDAAARLGGRDKLIVQDTRGVVGKGCHACADVRPDWKSWNWKWWVVDITGDEGFDIVRGELTESNTVEKGRKRVSPACDTFG